MQQERTVRGRPTEGPTPYKLWQQEQGIPVVTGYAVEDLNALPLAPWPRMGGLGTFINLEGTARVADAYVCEIPPRSTLNPERHMYEELIYILQGRGTTAVWQERGPRQRFQWQQGSLFSPPLNAWHEIANTGDEPARILGVTCAPVMIDLFRNLEFIFNCPFSFTDRYEGEELYFDGQGTLQGRMLETNFIPDVRRLELLQWDVRGTGSTNMIFDMAGNIMEAHSSEIPVGRYKKGHRHGPAAQIILLSGQGYSLMWTGSTLWNEGEPRVKVDWKPGSFFVPPNRWFHQHFNISPEPARYLALRFSGGRNPLGRVLGNRAAVETSIRLGGDQIEYEDEDLEIRRTYEAEMARTGVEITLPPARRSS